MVRLGNPRESIKILIKTIKSFSQVGSYKINSQKSNVFLENNKKLNDRKGNLTSNDYKMHKYLGIYLLKYTKDFCEFKNNK